MAPRPETLGFPLIEEKALPFEGTAHGPVRVRYGTAYFTTEEGFLYSVDVLSERILWRFKAEKPLPFGPELCDESITVRDDGNTIYVLDTDGRLIFKTTPADRVTTPVREIHNRVYFGCGNGRIAALDVQKNGQPSWEYNAGATVRSGPIFVGGLVLFGTDNGRVHALDDNGKPVWTFAARGPVRVDPAASDGRIYFATEERYFYCLEAATGKQVWRGRIPGHYAASPIYADGRLYFCNQQGTTTVIKPGRSLEPLATNTLAGGFMASPAVARNSLFLRTKTGLYRIQAAASQGK